MHQAVNLAQGFPDFPMPEPMKEAACTAIHGDINQYAITWGTPVLRMAIAEKYRRWYDMEVDPDRDVTVTCGATEAMASVFMALHRSGRRSDRPRAVLRELRSRRDSRRREAGVRAARAARLDARPRPSAQGVQRAHEGDHRQHAAQSDRPRAHARRDVADRRAVHRARRLGDHRRAYEHMVTRAIIT